MKSKFDGGRQHGRADFWLDWLGFGGLIGASKTIL
jgi:hypothetical protein